MLNILNEINKSLACKIYIYTYNINKYISLIVLTFYELLLVRVVDDY